jgi:glutathione synthase/RimK-type ligase-like ATP-grasp enzyme
MSIAAMEALRSGTKHEVSKAMRSRNGHRTTPRVHIIHENSEWTAPLIRALRARNVPHRDWHLDAGSVDLDAAPPAGIFYNRMSASSHTRRHRFAPELTAGVLDWLESHGAWIINPKSALTLELSKVSQYAALSRHGIRTPRTIAAVGEEALLAAAKRIRDAFITKHNRAGKGLGVRLFESAGALSQALERGEYEHSVDGVNLVQQYIKAPAPHITRLEFIGRRFLYAVRVDTSEGFELCPAQACAPEDAFCPVGESAAAKFEITEGFTHPLIRRFERFMSAEQLDVAAFEIIVDREGRSYTYDINTNTNYNPGAEARAGISAMEVLCDYLAAELKRYKNDFKSNAA